MVTSLIISDNLDNLRSFCNIGQEKKVDRSGLPPADRKLLACLSLNDPVFISPLLPDTGLDKGLRIVLVDNAPESQYDALASALRSGLDLPYPLACVAFTGKNFHGQRQRPWSAQRGNLHLTLYNRPEADIVKTRSGFIILPALAVIDAIAALAGGGLGLAIKWVNDIMILDKKIGGVLTTTQIRGDKTEAVVFGIGLNIAQRPVIAPSPLAPETDFLGTHLPEVTLPDIFWQILKDFGRRYRQLLAAGPQSMLDDYRCHSLVLGREVCIWEEDSVALGANMISGNPLFCGVVSAIGDDLSLLVNGREINRGRLSLVRLCEKFGVACSRR